MAYQFSQRYVAIGSGSTSTSNAFLVNDFRLLTVSVESSASLGPNNVTVWGSNADGLQQSDLGGPTSNVGWSVITVIQPGSLDRTFKVGSGVFTFDPPGYRWVRSSVSPANVSVASAMTVIFNGVSF